MFELVSDYSPAGDQPQAIEKLTAGILSGAKHRVLLGVAGSSKTCTVANFNRNAFCSSRLASFLRLGLEISPIRA